MEDIYTKEFLFYYKNQKNRQDLKKYTTKGREVNLSCGDDLTVKLLIKNGIVFDIGYTGEGCAVCEGSMSILSEYLENKSVKDITGLTKKDFLKLINIKLTPSRENCSLIGFNATKKAIK